MQCVDPQEGELNLKRSLIPAQGCAFANPGTTDVIYERRNSEGVASPSHETNPVATHSELRRIPLDTSITHGFKANPGLEFANAFSVRVLG